MIHKLFYQNRQLHGRDLRNVQVACRAIVKQAQPVDRQVARRSHDLCESCDATARPTMQNILYVREAQEHEAPTQAGLRPAA